MKLRTIALALSAMLWAGATQAAMFDAVYVFGDSLSDAGNNSIALGGAVTSTPISSNGFIPEAPYASGHYTNGPVWAQTFAAALGLESAPFLGGGTNYAFGGARTGPLDPSFPLITQAPPTLTTQAALFLAGHGNVASPDALYVVAGGGNNARDAAVAALAPGADVPGIVADASREYATDIKGIVDGLQAAGADDIIVWNVPDIGKTPAVRGLGDLAAAGASSLAHTMNNALLLALDGEQGVKVFDVFSLVDSAVADPTFYHLSNVTDACAFTGCDPSTYLFWDGIHPTSAGHAVFAEKMLALAVPEPSTYVLLAAGLGLLIAARLRTEARTA